MRTAYILLWFPKPTETFIFREVINLRRFGLPLQVFSLYGPWRRDLSVEMAEVADDVERLGVRALPQLLASFLYWLFRKPAAVGRLLRDAVFRRWRGVEKTAENLWAFVAGFHLARRFEAEGIEHIHAPWAGGPATAAWVAARLTGRPFTFTARAWDIYPPDALILDKIREAAFVRCETGANVTHLRELSGADPTKFELTYNGVPLIAAGDASVAMKPPVKVLAIGRFVAKKGFDQLIRATRLLADRGIDIEVTFAGDGPLGDKLKRQAQEFGLSDRIAFPGYVSYDCVGDLFMAADMVVMPCVIAASNDRDGIPTVIIEALLHRLPVVSTAVSGIPELIENEVTGLLVGERDPQALADAIARLIEDRDLALRLAEAGRARVHERFNPETNHRRVLDLYQRLDKRQ
ncbi:MAG: glycosyltransferase family 4 protein [Hyphomicrobiales bacterium]|nr:glycosyltransferase family 4 protein [Hyphomicrobiales bacterium]